MTISSTSSSWRTEQAALRPPDGHPDRDRWDDLEHWGRRLKVEKLAFGAQRVGRTLGEFLCLLLGEVGRYLTAEQERRWGDEMRELIEADRQAPTIKAQQAYSEAWHLTRAAASQLIARGELAPGDYELWIFERLVKLGYPQGPPAPLPERKLNLSPIWAPHAPTPAPRPLTQAPRTLAAASTPLAAPLALPAARPPRKRHAERRATKARKAAATPAPTPPAANRRPKERLETLTPEQIRTKIDRLLRGAKASESMATRWESEAREGTGPYKGEALTREVKKAHADAALMREKANALAQTLLGAQR